MNTKIRIEFNFGVGKDRFGITIPADKITLALDKICLEAAESFGGYGLHTVRGGWVDPRGNLVQEEGRSLVVYAEDQEFVNKVGEKTAHLVLTIKTALYQESVLVAQSYCFADCI